MAFTGKVVLITGGASGMGREMALRLARQGATVAIADLNVDAIASLVSAHSNVHGFPCDVTDEAQVLDMVERIESQLGPIDRLAHAAGIMPGNSILDSSASDIKKVMTINYFGTVHLTKAVLPGMLARNRGDIIVFGSITGFAFARKLSAYCASKAAVNAYTEVLIHEHKETDLRILLVCPPAVDTPLINQAVDSGPKSIRDVAKTKKMASPASIIDAIEVALEKGREVLFPAEASMIYRIRRLSPRLLWWLADKSEQ